MATPLVVAQSHHGYPSTSKDSIGSHDMGVLLDVPTKAWPTLFRPWDYGFFVVGVVKAFAFRWWMLSAILLVGSYALLLQLTRRIGIAIVFSIALWASPFYHWWYLDLSFVSAGMGMAALAAFLAALERPRGVVRTSLLALSAWALVSFALVIYPPFQIPVAILLMFVGIGDIWARYGSGRQIVRSVGGPLATVMFGSLVVVGLYYLDNRTALHLINGTVYPGKRRNTGGVGNFYQFLSAPYGLNLAKHGSSLSFSNQSELSSFIPVGPYICLQLLRVRFCALTRRAQAQLFGALAAFLLLLVWYFVGLPAPIAILTQLDRVPPYRAIGGMGLAGMLLVAIFSSGLRGPPPGFRRREGALPRLSAVAASGALYLSVVAFCVTYLSGRMLDGASPGLRIGSHTELVFSAAVALVVFLLGSGRALAGGSLLAALGMVVSLPANPLYRGLAPYSSPDLTSVFTDVRGSTGAGWLSFVGTPVTAELIASGLRTINSVSIYPDPAAWRVLDPTNTHRDTWDRYANLSFVPQSGLASPELSLVQADVVSIKLDPCSPQLVQLGVKFVVTGGPLSEGCLVPMKATILLGMPIFIYRIDRSIVPTVG